MSPTPRPAFAATLLRRKGRADKFKFEQHRQRLLPDADCCVSSWEYLQVEPAEVDFVYSAESEAVPAPTFAAGIRFNLARWTASRSSPSPAPETIGVDVELIRPLKTPTIWSRDFRNAKTNSHQQPRRPNRRRFQFVDAEGSAAQSHRRESGGLNRWGFFPAREPARLLAIAGDAEKAKGWERNLTPAPASAAAPSPS